MRFLAERFGLKPEAMDGDFLGARAGMRPRARGGVIIEAAEGIEVGAGIRLLAVKLLRRECVNAAEKRGASGRRIKAEKGKLE